MEGSKERFLLLTTMPLSLSGYVMSTQEPQAGGTVGRWFCLE